MNGDGDSVTVELISSPYGLDKAEPSKATFKALKSPTDFRVYCNSGILFPIHPTTSLGKYIGVVRERGSEIDTPIKQHTSELITLPV